MTRFGGFAREEVHIREGLFAQCRIAHLHTMSLGQPLRLARDRSSIWTLRARGDRGTAESASGFRHERVRYHQGFGRVWFTDTLPTTRTRNTLNQTKAIFPSVGNARTVTDRVNLLREQLLIGFSDRLEMIR